MTEDNIDKLALFNSMLETGFDDIENLPDFVNLLDGSFLLNIEKVEIGKTQDETNGSVSIRCSLVETLGRPEVGEWPELAPGSLVNFRYYGDFGIKKLKKEWAEVIAGLQCPTPAAFIDMAAGATIAVTTRSRADKEDKSVRYTDVVSAVLA